MSLLLEVQLCKSPEKGHIRSSTLDSKYEYEELEEVLRSGFGKRIWEYLDKFQCYASCSYR